MPPLAAEHDADILSCPQCGGRLRLVATIEGRAVIERILAHLGLPADPPEPAPATRSAWLPGFDADGGPRGADVSWPD